MTKSIFGSSVPKFNNNGVHPKLQVHNPSLSRSITSVIGPGYYDVALNDQMSKNRFAFQSWKRSYDLEQAKRLPHFLLKEKKQIEEEKIRKMGPGCYEIDKSLDFLTKFDLSTTVLQSKSQRFVDITKDCFPGPSTYGIPADKIDEATDRRKYSKSVGLLERGGKSSRLPSPPSYHIGPGIYTIESGIDQLVQSRTGKRNFYDCNSIDRSKPIKTGHRSILISHNLGPGQYNFNSDVDNHQHRDNLFKGKFLSVEQYPEKPYQRVFWSDPGNVPVDKMNQVSPASYNVVHDSTKKVGKLSSKSAFGSSDVRMNKFALANFLGENNVLIGPGRYNRDSMEIGQQGSGYQSVFKSRVPQIADENMVHTLRHRVRQSNIPNERKQKFDHYATENSIRMEFVPQDTAKTGFILA